MPEAAGTEPRALDGVRLALLNNRLEGIVRKMADRVYVMTAGQVVEEGGFEELINKTDSYFY